MMDNKDDLCSFKANSSTSSWKNVKKLLYNEMFILTNECIMKFLYLLMNVYLGVYID